MSAKIIYGKTVAEKIKAEVRAASDALAAAGRRRPGLAVIMVEFPDAKHNPAISSNNWAEFFFSRGTYSEKTNATGQNVFGSVNDYFHEVSASRLRVEGRIFPWYEVKGKRAEELAALLIRKRVEENCRPVTGSGASDEMPQPPMPRGGPCGARSCHP